MRSLKIGRIADVLPSLLDQFVQTCILSFLDTLILVLQPFRQERHRLLWLVWQKFQKHLLRKCCGNYSKFQGEKPKPQSFFNKVGDFQSSNFFKRNFSTTVFPEFFKNFLNGFLTYLKIFSLVCSVFIIQQVYQILNKYV